MGSHFFLQGIFPTQGLNPGRLHCRQILYWLSYKGSPYCPSSPRKRENCFPPCLTSLLTRPRVCRKGLTAYTAPLCKLWRRTLLGRHSLVTEASVGGSRYDLRRHLDCWTWIRLEAPFTPGLAPHAAPMPHNLGGYSIPPSPPLPCQAPQDSLHPRHRWPPRRLPASFVWGVPAWLPPHPLTCSSHLSASLPRLLLPRLRIFSFLNTDDVRDAPSHPVLVAASGARLFTPMQQKTCSLCNLTKITQT